MNKNGKRLICNNITLAVARMVLDGRQVSKHSQIFRKINPR